MVRVPQHFVPALLQRFLERPCFHGLRQPRIREAPQELDDLVRGDFAPLEVVSHEQNHATGQDGASKVGGPVASRLNLLTRGVQLPFVPCHLLSVEL
jgi:hypothetical protein